MTPAAGAEGADASVRDRDEIAQDPYAQLDVTICVPMPVVGGIVGAELRRPRS